MSLELATNAGFIFERTDLNCRPLGLIARNPKEHGSTFADFCVVLLLYVLLIFYKFITRPYSFQCIAPMTFSLLCISQSVQDYMRAERPGFDSSKGHGGRVMSQVVSRRPLTAEARVRYRFNKCGICSGQGGTGKVFLRVLRFSPVNVSFHRRSPNSYNLGNA
jgi:hypothetical protein